MRRETHDMEGRMRHAKRTTASSGLPFILGLALALTACAPVATGGDPGDPVEPADWETVLDEEELLLRVQNDLDPPDGAEVSIYPTARSARSLGTVAPEERQAFVVETDLFGGSYFLVAEKAGGGHVVSREVDVVRGAVVTWNLGTNQIRVERPRL